MKAKWTKGRVIFLIVWLALIIGLLTAIIIVGLPYDEDESIQEVMKDGVLHESNRVSFFGISVNPAIYSAYLVSALLLIAALLIRVIAVPRFRTVPGKFQALLEKAVGFFDGLAKGNCERKANFAGAYIFGAGVYIFFGTLFELLGIQAVTTDGRSVSLPAPLSDINGALSMGFLSFAVILGAGLLTNGPKGALRVLKDFSLPVSMSFRLFGALLSGLLVTELVYHYVALSFVFPVVVGVLFTLLHAIIQAYVLSMLVSVYYGEAVEHIKKKEKKSSKNQTTSESEVTENEK